LTQQALKFRTICLKNGMQMNDAELAAFSAYTDLLLEWNAKINLVSRKDTDRIWTRHLLGSISFLFSHSLVERTSLLDIGTGGGLPGIPIAILYPSIRITLVDSIRKKTTAVADIVSRLHLPNVEVITSRVEDLAGGKQPPAAYDYLFARAVAPMEDLITWGKPLLAPRRSPASSPGEGRRISLPTGSIILLKGGDIGEEAERARRRHQPSAIDVVPIVFDAGEAAGELVDKKMIIIRP